MIRSVLTAGLMAMTVLAPACARQDASSPDAVPQEAERIVPETQAQMQLSFAPVVRQAAPAVVNVYSRRVVSQRSPFAGDPFFERFFGPQRRERDASTLGSGVIVDASGIVVTNNHVVQGAQELRIVLSDRREYEATLLLADERTDLAVLQIETDEALPVIAYGGPTEPEVGDLVLAIGNPFGVGQTVTSGIVSALARTDVGITDYAFFIQTDAAVNPGNSGGALVDMSGALIGVNTAIFSRSGGSNGIGFAIPVEMVRTVVSAALEDGEIVRPWLGARLQSVTSDLASSIGLDRPQGAIVAEIWPQGAADRAGLQQGDVVVAVDGVAVNDEAGAQFRFATRMIGETAELTVLRDGQNLDLVVVAEPAPGPTEGVKLDVTQRSPFTGSQLVQLSPAFNEENGLDPFSTGVMISRVGRRSAADYFGFRPGDRLLEINGEPVDDLNDAAALLNMLEGEKLWPIEIERRGEVFSRTLSL